MIQKMKNDERKRKLDVLMQKQAFLLPEVQEQMFRAELRKK